MILLYAGFSRFLDSLDNLLSNKTYLAEWEGTSQSHFTLRDDSVTDEDILENFRSVFAQVYEESRIKAEIIEDTIDNHMASGSLKFIMNYVATHGADEIKIDATRGETIEFDVEHQVVLNNYTDLGEEDETLIHCSLQTSSNIARDTIARLPGCQTCLSKKF